MSAWQKPRLGELLLGTEGLALLRLAFAGDDASRSARVSEMRTLLERMDDPELSARLAAPEYDLAEGYELWSKTYDAPLRLFFIEQDPMHGLFATLSAGTVLDAACGTGRHSAHLAQAGHRIVGVDRSPAMLAKARAKLPQGDFRDGDLNALPVETAAVDAVVCALALVHLPDLTGAMAEFSRVVRPGGRVIISDVHPFLIMLGWQAQFRTEAGGAGFVAAIFVAPGTGSGNRIAASTPCEPRSAESLLHGGQTHFQRVKIRHHQTDMAVDDLWGSRRQVKLLVTGVDPHII